MEDDLLPQEYREPAYKLDPDVEHDPLHTMVMACSEMEELIKTEGSCGVDEVIGERLTWMMTAMIPRMLNESFQHRLKTSRFCGILSTMD